MENFYILCTYALIGLCCYFLYIKYKKRNDGDYTVINKYSTQRDDRIVYYVDIQHKNTGKILLKVRISWKHQTKSDLTRTIRITNGVFYLITQKGDPYFARHEKIELMEREDIELP